MSGIGFRKRVITEYICNDCNHNADDHEFREDNGLEEWYCTTGECDYSTCFYIDMREKEKEEET